MTEELVGARSVDALPIQPRTLDKAGLQALIDALRARGYTVIGPTVSGGAIVNSPIRTLDDLPRGWGDEQESAHYRLRRRGAVRQTGLLPYRRVAVAGPP